MDEYKEELFRESLSGIPISAWRKFFSIFSEEQTVEGMLRLLDAVAASETPAKVSVSEGTLEGIKDRIAEIINLARSED